MADKFAGGVKAGSTSVSTAVLLRNTSDNQATTGKLFSDVTGSYWRQGGIRVSITMATLATVDAAYSSGGFVEVDATNQPGMYRLDVPNAAFASGADWVIVSCKVAGSYVVHQRYELETKGASENNAELTNASYGLSKLVRSTTPANTLTVETDGMAHSDLREWRGTVPNILVSGRNDVSVGAMAANVLTAAAIAADAITAAKIAADAITGSELSAAACNKICDIVARRSYANIRSSTDGEAVSFRSFLGLIASAVNKRDASSGSDIKFYHQDDTTLFETSTVTTSATADPMTIIDPS